MDDVILSFLLTFIMGMVIIIPTVVLFLLKDRLPLPIHKIYTMYIYSLPEGEEYTPGEEIDLSRFSLRKELKFWKVMQKGTLWFRVQTFLISGFRLDYRFKACIRNFDTGAGLRVIEIKRDVFQSSNYIPIDLPKNIPNDKFQADLSYTAQEVHEATRHQLSRAKLENWWKEIVLPIALILLFIMLMFFGYMHLDNQAKIQQEGTTAALNRFNILLGEKAQNTTANQTQQQNISIPFITGG